MDLKAYIYSKKMKMQDVARLLKINPATLSRLVKGYYKPRKTLVNKIIKWSNGELTEKDISDLYQEPKVCPFCDSKLHVKIKNPKVLEVLQKGYDDEMKELNRQGKELMKIILSTYGNNSKSLMGVNE